MRTLLPLLALSFAAACTAEAPTADNPLELAVGPDGGSLDADGLKQVGAQNPSRNFTAEFFLRVNERQLEPGGELARDAEVRLAVGAVRRDLDVEDRIAGR